MTAEPRFKSISAWVAIGLATTIAVAAVAVGSASAFSAAGGLGTPAPPDVREISCSSGCLDLRKVAVGGRIEISGRSLGAVVEVDFAGSESAQPRRATERKVVVKVPKGAKDGAVSVRTASGLSADSADEIKVAAARALQTNSGFKVTRATVAPARSYFDDGRRTSVEYLFKGRTEVDVRIDVVGKGRKVVDSFVQRNREPYANHRARWDGLNERGRIPPAGKYRFEIKPLGTTDGKPGRAKFRYFDHIFPLRSKRTDYGDGLGAGRGHQGQDVFARCGTKVVAARGGRVQTSEYHSAAGWFVVVDGARTKRDYAYMHMERGGRPKAGERVRTGERIGLVSDTGRASGCHLHFELWSSPGWYEGGHPLNPTRLLKRWQKWS